MTTGEMHATVASLTKVLNSERIMINEMKDYIKVHNITDENVSIVIAWLDWENYHLLLSPEQKLADACSGFKAMMRLVKDWGYRRRVIEEAMLLDHPRIVEIMDANTAGFPNEDDFTRAAEAVIRLQYVYEFSPKDLASGAVHPNAGRLDAASCYILAKVTKNKEDWINTARWLEYAFELVTQHEDKTIGLNFVYPALLESYDDMNDVRYLHRMRELANMYLEAELDEAKAKAFVDKITSKINKEIEHKQKFCDNNEECIKQAEGEFRDSQVTDVDHSFVPVKHNANIEKYKALCRGDQNVYKGGKHLHCSIRRYSPIHVLRPLKEEILLLEPVFVAVYHDLLSDEDISTLQSIARPHLNESVMVNDFQNEDFRDSETAWVGDFESHKVKAISERSVSIGNLSNEICEDFQVVCYGPGGHYTPHLDSSPSLEHYDIFGDRIATVLHYLNHVEGGATVFPELNLRIEPEKGMALFWFNLFRNGTLNPDTLHAGCPVIHGNKWIANKWVRNVGNIFQRPCLLDSQL